MRNDTHTRVLQKRVGVRCMHSEGSGFKSNVQRQLRALKRSEPSNRLDADLAASQIANRVTTMDRSARWKPAMTLGWRISESDCGYGD